MRDHQKASLNGRSSSSLTVEDIFAFDPRSEDPKIRAEINRLIGAKFYDYLEQKLSNEDYQLYLQDKLTPPSELLDQFILDQAKTIGARVMLCHGILARVVEWQEKEKDGPRLLARLGKNLCLAARVSRGLAKGPLENPGFYQFKDEFVSELKEIQKRVKACLADRNRTPSNTELQELINTELNRSPEDFERLVANQTSFLSYLTQKPEAAGLLVSGHLTAPKMADEYLAWSTNRDEEGTRQRVSRLGSKKSPLRIPSKK